MPYRFKKEYRDSIIEIPALRLRVTRFNLTEELAEKIIRKFPKFAHNLEKFEELPVEEETVKVVEEAGGDMEYPVEDYDTVSEDKAEETLEDLTVNTPDETLPEEEQPVKPEPKNKSQKNPKPKGSIKQGKKQKGK